MNTRVWLIRHGETDHHRTRRYCGLTDVPLNNEGRRQARRLARHLAGQTVDAVYASTLQRAYAMAELIFDPTSHSVERLAGLNEMHFGRWEGLTHEEAMAGDPDVYTEWLADPEKILIPGGEALGDFKKRVLSAIAGILKRHRGGNVMVVSHGGPIRIVVSQALEVPLRNLPRIKLDLASISLVEYYDGVFPFVCTVNSTAHRRRP